MKRLSIALLASLTACATPAAAPADPAAPAAVVTGSTASCPTKTEVLFRPEPPTEGFVPAAPAGATAVRPVRLQGERPGYPAQSVRCREEGDVVIHFCVTAEGRMQNVQIATSSGYARLDNAVLAWAARERYVSGSVNGRARLFCGLTATLDFDVPAQPETTPAL